MSVPETEQQCPNRNIYISEIRILLKTYSQNLGYIHVTLLYTWACDHKDQLIYYHKD